MTKAQTDEFNIYLISSASMDIFGQNTMASFTNQFNEPIFLEGDWRVALTEITFPTAIKNVTDTEVWVHSDDDSYKESGEIAKLASYQNLGKQSALK